MNVIRNILAVIGALAIVGAAIAYPTISRFAQFDEGAFDTYAEMMEKLLETGNPAEATVWKMKVADGITFEELEETMRFVANEHNFQNVGELPFYQQIEAIYDQTPGYEGQKRRVTKFYLFCDALVGADMLDFSDAYSAYMPCRISVVEDKEGNLWLYSMNMDMMIHGGDPLPPKLKEDAIRVKKVMLDIMNRGASGDF